MTFKARGVALVVAAAFVAGLPAAALAQRDDKKRSRQERDEIETLVKLLDGAIAGEPAPTDVQMKIEPVFLKSQEARIFVPFTLEVTGFPEQKDAALYIRVVDPNEKVDPKKKPEYPWDDVHFVPATQLAGSPARLNRVFMARPGTYDVYALIKERVPEKSKSGPIKAGLLKTSITVPDLNSEFTTSSILVADKVNALTQPLTMDEARERPFSFGLQELVPAADMNFTKAEELSIFFQVYNPGLNANSKPDLTLEYSFHRKEGAEEKFFNKTNPQAVNETNLPPQFDPAKFPVPGGVTVPLTSFAEGDYRLEIKVTDKTSSKVLTRNINFSVKG